MEPAKQKIFFLDCHTFEAKPIYKREDEIQPMFEQLRVQATDPLKQFVKYLSETWIQSKETKETKVFRNRYVN